MKSKSQQFAGFRRDFRGSIADGNHSVERSSRLEGRDTWRRVFKANRCGIVAPGVVQDMAAVGSYDQFDSKDLGCLVKFTHLVTGSVCYEENLLHAGILLLRQNTGDGRL